MPSYCLKCRKYTESKDSRTKKVSRTKNGRIIILSKCTVCDSEKIKIHQRARSKWIIKE